MANQPSKKKIKLEDSSALDSSNQSNINNQDTYSNSYRENCGNSERISVQKLNKIFALLPSFENSKFELKTFLQIPSFTESNIFVISTNVPKLLLLNIYKILKTGNQEYFDGHNIFVDPQMLKNSEIFKDFQNILKKFCEETQNQNKNNRYFAIVDFTKKIDENILRILQKEASKLILVVSKEDYVEKLSQVFEESNKVLQKYVINYNWSSLTIDSQKQILSHRDVNICEKSFPLTDLFPSVEAENLEEIIDDTLLNKLLEDSEIFDVLHEDKECSRNREILFQSRKLIKNATIKDIKQLNAREIRAHKAQSKKNGVTLNFKKKPDGKYEVTEIRLERIELSQENHILDVENQKYVLVADFAGNGKSCLLKNTKRRLNQKYPNKLIVYVEIKNFIHVFKSSKIEIDTEIMENILINDTCGVIDVENSSNNDQNANNVIDLATDSDSEFSAKSIQNNSSEEVNQSEEESDDSNDYEETANNNENDSKFPEILIDFVSFMTTKILALENKYEAGVFKNLYNNGKVIILLDGFDEIAPDYAEFVLKVIKSFESNNGNQMWISTRDYLKEKLMRELNISVSYSLDNFTEGDGVDLIINKWIIEGYRGKSDDSENQIIQKSKRCSLQYSSDQNEATNETIKDNSRASFSTNAINNSQSAGNTDQKSEIYFKDHANYEFYLKMACDVVQKISNLKILFTGCPRFYEILATIFSEDKFTIDDTSNYKIYEGLIEHHVKVWSIEKGTIRSKANIKFQMKGVNFVEYHQYKAAKKLFPKLKLHLSDWSNDEVLACGLMKYENGELSFIHETFLDFFAVGFIVRLLKNRLWEKIENFAEFFYELLSSELLKTSKVFLNEVFFEETSLKQNSNNMQKFTQNFVNEIFVTDHVIIAFNEQTENFLNTFIKNVKNCNYETVRDPLASNFATAVTRIENEKIFKKIIDFYFDTFKKKDMKNLIRKTSILQALPRSKVKFKFVEYLVLKIKEKLGDDFLKEALLLKENAVGDIITGFLKFDAVDDQTFNFYFELLEKYLGDSELIDVITNCQSHQMNILHKCISREDPSVLQLIWTKIENFLKSKNSWSIFKNLIIQPLPICRNRSAFHRAAQCRNFEFFESLWQLIIQTFEDQNEFFDLLTRQDRDKNTFIHTLVSYNTPQFITYTFDILKEILTADNYKKILTLRGFKRRNLLMKAADNSPNLEVHKALWKIVQNSCENNEEFLEYLRQTDQEHQNIFYVAASFLKSGEVFEFMIQETEKIASSDEIKNFLFTENVRQENILQSAVKINRSIPLHESLWQVYNKIFSQDEMLQLFDHTEKYGSNLMHVAAAFATKSIIEFTWNKMKDFMNEDERIKYLEQRGFRNSSLSENAQMKNRNSGVVEFIQTLMNN